MTIHDLKTWPEYFQAVKRGKKKFEYRKADRPYAVGDLLRLMEYDPDKEEFTGDEIYMGVGYILHGGSMGIPDGYCIMSLLEETKQCSKCGKFYPPKAIAIDGSGICVNCMIAEVASRRNGEDDSK